MSNKKKELQELKNLWYKKLENEGFKDIEAKDGRLKTWSYSVSRIAYKYKDLIRDSKTQYYQLAEHFLNEYKFKSNFERIVWEYHSTGLGYQNIVDILQKLDLKKYERLTKMRVRYLINNLKKKMFSLYGINTRNATQQ
jgi:hypothetical protein